MSEIDEHARPPSGPESPSDLAAEIYDDEGVIRGDFVSRVEEAIAAGNRDVLRDEVGSLHESEVGDLIEALPPEQRRQLVGLMGEDFDFAALTEVDGAIRSDIVDNMPNAQIAQAVQEMDSDDAVYILEDLDQEDRDEILAQQIGRVHV